jgi:hypothetical protein
MTVIELLAAATLAALLLMTVSATIGSLSTQRRALLRDGVPQPWRQQLLGQLYWDLANARWMESRPDQLVLVGYGGRDVASGFPTQRPCRVVYRVQQVGSRTQLVRDETNLESQSRSDARTELACVGVTRLDARLLDESGDIQPDGPIAVQGRIHVVLEGAGQASPLIDQVYFFGKPPKNASTPEKARRDGG